MTLEPLNPVTPLPSTVAPPAPVRTVPPANDPPTLPPAVTYDAEGPPAEQSYTPPSSSAIPDQFSNTVLHFVQLFAGSAPPNLDSLIAQSGGGGSYTPPVMLAHENEVKTPTLNQLQAGQHYGAAA